MWINDSELIIKLTHICSICLTLSWRRPLLYRNQSIDLLRLVSIWNGLRHKRVKTYFVFINRISVFSDWIKWIGNTYRSRHTEMFLRKDVLKICSKFTGEHSSQSVISIKLLCSFIEIELWHVSSAVNLLRISRIPFPRKTAVWPLLHIPMEDDALSALSVKILQMSKVHLIGFRMGLEWALESVKIRNYLQFKK